MDRTSGSSASGGTPGGVGDPGGLPEQRDEVVRRDGRGGVVAARARRRIQPERAQPERHREALDRGGSVDRAPRAREPCDPELGRRQRLQRVERADLDVGAGRVQLVELVERAGAREVDHQRPRPAAPARARPRCRRCRRRASPRSRGRRRARRRRPRPPVHRAARPPRRVDGASGTRPATATGVHPRATSAAATVVPARPGPTRASARCDRLCSVHLFVPSPLRSGPGAGAGLLGQRQC